MKTTESPTERTMSVGQLRQNPAPMVHDVEDGRSWVLTNHGRAFARVVPYARESWVPVGEVTELLNTATDPEWLAELEADRAASELRDPWSE